MAASVHVPNRAPINDAYIAATALVHGLTMATGVLMPDSCVWT